MPCYGIHGHPTTLPFSISCCIFWKWQDEMEDRINDDPIVRTYVLPVGSGVCECVAIHLIYVTVLFTKFNSSLFFQISALPVRHDFNDWMYQMNEKRADKLDSVLEFFSFSFIEILVNSHKPIYTFCYVPISFLGVRCPAQWIDLSRLNHTETEYTTTISHFKIDSFEPSIECVLFSSLFYCFRKVEFCCCCSLF